MRPMIVEFDVHFDREGKGAAKQIKEGADPAQGIEEGRLPRIVKLMALAIKFERLIREGEIRDYAQLAELGHVTRARVTQIMNLNLLSPSIQEEILFLPRVTQGRDPIVIRDLQPIALEVDWKLQQKMWATLKQQRDG